MTPYEQELLKKYLAHRNVIGDEGSYPDFEAWYQEIRYAQGPAAPTTLEEASELRYKDVLNAARLFNRLLGKPSIRVATITAAATLHRRWPRPQEK